METITTSIGGVENNVECLFHILFFHMRPHIERVKGNGARDGSHATQLPSKTQIIALNAYLYLLSQ